MSVAQRLIWRMSALVLFRHTQRTSEASKHFDAGQGLGEGCATRGNWHIVFDLRLGPRAEFLAFDHCHDRRDACGKSLQGNHLMRTMQASEFRAKCLALLDQVAITGETIVVTKNGKPVAELRPHHPPRAKSLIGLHKDQIKINGDIITPVSIKM